MCYQFVELYSACRCLYYQYAVDRCAEYGRPRHPVQRKEILVGYACSLHGGGYPSAYQEGKQNINYDKTDTDSVVSGLSASTALPIPRESREDAVTLLMRDLLNDAELKYLLPQLVRQSRTQINAQKHISRFLRRFSRDLNHRGTTAPEKQAARFVRQCRAYISRHISEKYSFELSDTAEGSYSLHDGKELTLEHGFGEENENDGEMETKAVYGDLHPFLLVGPAFESFKGTIMLFVSGPGVADTTGAPSLGPMGKLVMNKCSELIATHHVPLLASHKERIWWTCVCPSST